MITDHDVADALETKTDIEIVTKLAVMTKTSDVERLLGLYGTIDTTMPIVDPTGYRKILKTKQGHVELARAFLQFRKSIDKIIANETHERRI